MLPNQNQSWGFLSYDRTYTQTNRDYYFIYSLKGTENWTQTQMFFSLYLCNLMECTKTMSSAKLNSQKFKYQRLTAAPVNYITSI